MNNTQRVIIQKMAGQKDREALPVKEKTVLKPKSFESVTVSSTATNINLPTYDIMDIQTKAIITVEDANIRFKIDGNNPTTTEGHLADIGDIIKLTSNEEIENFRAISTTSNDATIQVSYLEVS
jgi:hypothetical protein